MTVTPSNASPTSSPAMLAEVARVRELRVLGPAGRLVELFDYLLSRSAEDRPPKEAEIALAVFGKAPAGALHDDPVARVYVHRLRKRLDEFYLRHGAPAGVRLDIPKGDYRICLNPVETAKIAFAPAAATTQADLGAAPKARRTRWDLIAAAFATVLVGGNIAAWAMLTNKSPAEAQLVETNVWSGFAHSDRPLLIVVGDYYVFGEYEDRLSLKRLIRDFSINSKADLVHAYRDDPKGLERYSDVALQYLPASVAFAIADLAPILRQNDRDVQVVLASELTPDRLKSNDIIYVGLLSGMGPLRDPVFAQSRFTFGETYDQIIDRKSGRMYTSEAFLAAPSDTMYRDYGFFSTFKGPAGNRIAILSGSRDTAVMGVAEKLTHAKALAELQKKLPDGSDFEALFEVKGQKHINLETRVLASYDLDSQSIWTGANANAAGFPAK